MGPGPLYSTVATVPRGVTRGYGRRNAWHAPGSGSTAGYKRFAEERALRGAYVWLEVTADNNGSERELRPTATYRKVSGGSRSKCGAELYAAARSVIGTAARRGIGAFQAI